MKDYHAADHDYIRDIRRHSETAERRDTLYRPPDFKMSPTYTDIRRRRQIVTAFGASVGIGIMLGVIAAVLFLP